MQDHQIQFRFKMLTTNTLSNKCLPSRENHKTKKHINALKSKHIIVHMRVVILDIIPLRANKFSKASVVG